ncbi:MAG: beta-galactosidase [Phycisphaerae bacterium]|nr:beta-galactosidase [Phycisphaerae bacterium]
MYAKALIVCAFVAGIGCNAVAEMPTDPSKIPDSQYVQVNEDGHLELDGRRVRYWGHIGHFPAGGDDGPAGRRNRELMAQRLVDLGFNLHRLWHFPQSDDFTKGDNSADDLKDYGYYLLKKHGIKIWFCGLNMLGTVDAERDVKIIDDPDTAEAWKAAIASMAHESWRWEGKQVGLGRHLAQHWDPRLKALALQRMREVATRRNKYTGMRYCDDPDIVVWELSNEEWWLPKMTGGQWMTLPKFFQAQLIAKWNAWLKRKYETDEGLTAAWGFLFPGEGLDDGTVMLAPTAKATSPAQLNDANPYVREALAGGVEKIGRDQCSEQRAADAIAFFVEMITASKNAQATFVKSLGKSTRLSPMLYDTGTGWQIQCQYLHQQADAVTHCTYISNMHHDRADEEFPFNSSLTELPRACWDVPWVEHNKVEGKPFFVYETQVRTTTKYRAEFPMLMASLGSIQDWDIINWHSYGPGPDSTRDAPHTRALEVGHSGNLHYGGDEVQLSAMRAASEIFCNEHLAPAPTPTKFVYGKPMLLASESMDYSGSYGEIGRAMLPTTYRYGMRLEIDPTLSERPDDPLFEQARQARHGEAADAEQKAEQRKSIYEDFRKNGYMVIGPYYKPRVFEPNPITPTEQISYDWRQGFCRFDAPGAAMFTGFSGRLRDANATLTFDAAGVALSDVAVHNPDGMPYPVTADEGYVTFALASRDDQPLAETRRAVLSLVSTSFNTGFGLEMSKDPSEYFGAKVAKGKAGTLPVLVARVSGTVRGEAIDGMDWTFYDYEMNVLDRGRVSDGVLRIPADKPVFYVTLER